jgi:hypothetical protein
MIRTLTQKNRKDIRVRDKDQAEGVEEEEQEQESDRVLRSGRGRR